MFSFRFVFTVASIITVAIAAPQYPDWMSQWEQLQNQTGVSATAIPGGWPSFGSLGELGNNQTIPTIPGVGGEDGGWPSFGSLGDLGNNQTIPAIPGVGGEEGGWPSFGSLGDLANNQTVPAVPAIPGVGGDGGGFNFGSIPGVGQIPGLPTSSPAEAGGSQE